MSKPRREHMLRDRWEQQLRADPAVAGSMLLVLLTMATYGDRDGTNVRVSQATLSDATGLGKSTVRRHQARGVELAWLRQESRGCRTGNGQTISSVYSLALPSSTAHKRAVEDGSTAQERAVEDSSTAQSQPLNRSLDASLPLAGEHLPGSDQVTPPPPAGGAADDEPANVLAKMVVEGLPEELATQLTRTTVTTACRRLADDGWTPVQLAEAVVLRQWHGAQAGAVIVWLRDLSRPRPAPTRVTCGACNGAGFVGYDDDERPRPCPTCKPHLATAAATA